MTSRQEYVDAIAEAALTLGREGVMRFLLAKSSGLVLRLLTSPFIGSVVSFAVSYILEIAIKETELKAFFIYTDFRVSDQGNDFVDAALYNARMRKTGTPQEKKDAEDLLKTRFDNFVRLSA